MTLHISELTIQMRVREEEAAAGAAERDSVGGAGGAEPCGCELSPQQVEDIVALSVRRTLAALRALKER